MLSASSIFFDLQSHLLATYAPHATTQRPVRNRRWHVNGADLRTSTQGKKGVIVLIHLYHDHHVLWLDYGAE